MGLEILPLFWIPLLIILGILIALLFSERRQADRTERILGLGRGRIVKGYLSTLGTLLLLLYIGEILDEPFSWQQMGIVVLYFFPAFAVMMLFLLTVLGLPVMSLLRKFGYLSLAGVVCMNMVVTTALGLLFSTGMDIVLAALAIGILTLAFSLAARLPLLRSPPTPAHSSPQDEKYTRPT
jgi:hypothetical protein